MKKIQQNNNIIRLGENNELKMCMYIKNYMKA